MNPDIGESEPSTTALTVVEDRSRGYGWARRTLYGEGGWVGAAWRGLSGPLGWAWESASQFRLSGSRRASGRLPAPAVSVGNVTVGGSGKTTLILWLLERGLPAGCRAAVLTRGYGRTAREVWVLSPDRRPPSPSAVGDEPALIARAGAWVGVGADREIAARALVADFQPDLFLLDDGLQNRRVGRSLDLVAFTYDDFLAPARCLPSGPLRQGPDWRPPNGAWVSMGCDPREQDWRPGSIGAEFAEWWRELPGTTADWVDAGTVSLEAWSLGDERDFEPDGRNLVAFAGVAKPESVARFAAIAKLPIERLVAYPDHHAYSQKDVAMLLDAFPEASFVTTEKDAIKCDPEWFEGRSVGVLRRRIKPRETNLLTDIVSEAIAWPR